MRAGFTLLDMTYTHSHVSVVDTHTEFAEPLAHYLRGNGMRVTELRTVEALLDLMTSDKPDIVLMGATNAGSMAVARKLNERWRCGLILLADSDTMVDRVVGLEGGADDYVLKRIERRELLARVRAILRRTTVTGPDAEPVAKTGSLTEKTYSFHGWQASLASRSIRNAEFEDVHLTWAEFDLLCVLLAHTGHVLSREAISGLLASSTQGRTIDVLISRLRKKLEIDSRRPRIIKSVRGAGYLLVPG
jgi:two-component system OmpR family response regulator